MPRNATKSTVTPPPLFRLRTLSRNESRLASRGSRNGEGQSLVATTRLAEKTIHLRIDHPQVELPPFSSTVKSTEQRLSRLATPGRAGLKTAPLSAPLSAPLTTVGATVAARLDSDATVPKVPEAIVCEAEQVSRSAGTADWFHDHVGDLISRIGQWSVQIDRRESQLDHREQELNRRSRVLRQNQCNG